MTFMGSLFLSLSLVALGEASHYAGRTFKQAGKVSHVENQAGDQKSVPTCQLCEHLGRNPLGLVKPTDDSSSNQNATVAT